MNESNFILATDHESQWLGGWWASEKLDGCRAYWDGCQFWTRSGNIIPAPRWFTQGLPDVHLDGEIWAGRKGFQDASNAVRLGGKWFETPGLEFAAFDAPHAVGTWPQRMAEVRKAVARASCAVAVAFSRVNDALWTGNRNDLAEMLLRFSRLGSEGLMFRNPDAKSYETGRSKNLLGVKF